MYRKQISEIALRSGTHFWQKSAYFSSKFLWFYMLESTKLHEKPSKTKSETIFGSRKSIFGPFFAIFYIINLYWKSPISAIPDYLLTQISRARKNILAFRKKRWIRKEKYFNTKSTSFWTPKYGGTPYRLK